MYVWARNAAFSKFRRDIYRAIHEAEFRWHTSQLGAPNSGFSRHRLPLLPTLSVLDGTPSFHFLHPEPRATTRYRRSPEHQDSNIGSLFANGCVQCVTAR